jgi:hypothetical protein
MKAQRRQSTWWLSLTNLKITQIHKEERGKN